jgi:hypothetical protein
MRRTRKRSASRIAYELQVHGTPISRRTVTRYLATIGLDHRRFIDPNGESNRTPQKDHRSQARPHGSHRREEGRTHP